MVRITTTLSKQEVLSRAFRLGQVLAGNVPDVDGVARGFSLAVGMAALGNVRGAYVTKARGGTDEMGIKWPPLSPQTIANRKIGPGDRKAKEGSGVAGVRQATLVRQRERIEKREFKKLFRSLALKMPESQARARAKQMASQRATRETGIRRIDLLGGRDVEILRDTGRLFNSLKAGTRVGSSYQPIEDQVFNFEPGKVTLGTEVIYAATHQFGDSSRNIPRRQFLPDDDDTLPQVWLEDMSDAAEIALVQSLTIYFQ